MHNLASKRNQVEGEDRNMGEGGAWEERKKHYLGNFICQTPSTIHFAPIATCHESGITFILQRRELKFREFQKYTRNHTAKE